MKRIVLVGAAMLAIGVAALPASASPTLKPANCNAVVEAIAKANLTPEEIQAAKIWLAQHQLMDDLRRFFASCRLSAT